jgi:hypothetical protein
MFLRNVSRISTYFKTLYPTGVRTSVLQERIVFSPFMLKETDLSSKTSYNLNMPKAVDNVEHTKQTERPPLVDEVSANSCR